MRDNTNYNEKLFSFYSLISEKFKRKDFKGKYKVTEYLNPQIDNMLVDLLVLFAGKQKIPPSTGSEGMGYQYILHYIYEGEGFFVYNGKEYNLSQGDTFLISPKQIYRYYSSEKNPWSYYWIGFSGTRASSLLSRSGMGDSVPIIRNIQEKEIPELFSKIITTLQKNKRGGDIAITAFLSLIFSIFIDKVKTKKQENTIDIRKKCVNKAINFVKINFSEITSVEEIADFVGYNRSYFSNIFRTETGKSIKQYLNNYRIKKAVELLDTTNFNIDYVAQSVGYKNYFSFEKRFKKIMNCTPTEYRKR